MCSKHLLPSYLAGNVQTRCWQTVWNRACQGSSGCTPINVPILFFFIGFLWGILKILGITIHIYPLYRAYIGISPSRYVGRGTPNYPLSLGNRCKMVPPPLDGAKKTAQVMRQKAWKLRKTGMGLLDLLQYLGKVITFQSWSSPLILKSFWVTVVWNFCWEFFSLKKTVDLKLWTFSRARYNQLGHCTWDPGFQCLVRPGGFMGITPISGPWLDRWQVNTSTSTSMASTWWQARDSSKRFATTKKSTKGEFFWSQFRWTCHSSHINNKWDGRHQNDHFKYFQ